MVGNLVWSGSYAFSVLGLLLCRGLSCKKKRMYCCTCRVLEILVRFLFWSRQWYGGLVFVLWWIQAAVLWVLTSPWPFFYFAQFSWATSVMINDTVSLCQKSSNWCLASAKRHGFKKIFENAEMKLLDDIFFLIPVLNCALLYFSSSHTQTDRAPCNNKQYWTASL